MCQLHGNNCIGNNRKEDERAPHIGNNVEIGVGAKIIGDIYVVDNVKIGANAVVVKSCFTNGAIGLGKKFAMKRIDEISLQNAVETL